MYLKHKIYNYFLMTNKLMKYSFLTLFVFIIFSTTVRSDTENTLDVLLSKAKTQCERIGFKPSTEKYADCVMRLLPNEEEGTGKQTTEVLKEVKAKNKDKKVEEKATNSLKFKEATYVGEVKKGKAHGFGVFTFSDGSVYEGKVYKNRIRGEGKYTDVNNNIYKGYFKNGTLRYPINKNIREILKLRPNSLINFYAEMRGEGNLSNKWFRAEKNPSGIYELTAKGERDMRKAINLANSGGDQGNSSGGSGGACGD
jgi:hypothetical protein